MGPDGPHQLLLRGVAANSRFMRHAARWTLFFVSIGLACSHPHAPGASALPTGSASGLEQSHTSPASPAERRRAAHALDRLAYGPRPGDIDRVASAGVDAWIEAQLSPSSLRDEALEARLAELPALKMSIAELHNTYVVPSKDEKAARAARKTQQAEAGPGAERGRRGVKERGPAPDMGPAGGLESSDPETMRGDRATRQGRPPQIAAQWAEAKLLRATMSPQQVEEVLTDFWFNRFNVFFEKGLVRWSLGPYERDAIRPHIFGKFRDLLGATASHPAMLVYLDNWQSVADGTKKKKGQEGGLNENYGRELLELHTLGVDGGYSQEDVRNVARAFTGWTIDRPQKDSAFVFRPRQHDEAPKKILGQVIQAGGRQDGEAVLDLVARHPATAKSVARALAVRFVSDDPPAALTEELASVFASSNGDLRAVYRKLFSSAAFWAEEAYGAKVKKPFDFVVSAIRAAGATYDGSEALVRRMVRLGEPLYRCQPPTGYKDTADAWVNAGGLVNRINFGLDLGAGRIPGVAVDAHAFATGIPDGDASAAVDRIAAGILDKPLGGATRATIVGALQKSDLHPKADYSDPTPIPAPQIVGLLVGSPEFQKR